MGVRRRWRVPYVVIDAAVISVDGRNGGPAREKCDSQKQRYGDSSGADMACDFCFHKAFAFTFSFGKFWPALHRFFRNRNFFIAQSRIARDHDTIRSQEETIEQHRIYHVVAHAAVH